MLIKFTVHQHNYPEATDKIVNINPKYVVAVYPDYTNKFTHIDVAHNYLEGEASVGTTWYVKGDEKTVTDDLNIMEMSTL